MKIAGDAARRFLTRADPEPRMALIHGADAGDTALAAQALTAAWLGGDDMSGVIRHDEDSIKSDPMQLRDDLEASSLFGGASIVLVRLVSEKQAGRLADIASDTDAGRFKPAAALIVQAPLLPPRSKLRTAFEKASCAVCLQLYDLDERAKIARVRERLKGQGTDIAEDAATILVQHAGANLQHLDAETDKVALFAHPASPIDAAHVEAVVVNASDSALDTAALSALAGDPSAAMSRLNAAFAAGAQPIAALNTLRRELLRLRSVYALSAAPSGWSDALAATSPRLAFDLLGQAKRALALWSLRSLDSALDYLDTLELASKTAASPAQTYTARTYLALALMAQARR